MLLCVLLLAQETPFGSLVFGLDCVDACEDDVSSGRCPIGCAACACPSHSRSVNFSEPTGTLTPEALEVIDARATFPAEDLRADSIFHVPRLSS